MRKIIVLALVALLVSGCLEQPVVLEQKEVREYQGEKLDSVNDFRENSIKGPQYIDVSSYRLRVSGLVNEEKNFTYSEVLGHQAYQKVVRLDCVEGWSVNILWEGVLVKDLINEAGAKPEADTVIFHAYDGYTTSFPLKYLEDNNILLAYKMNNATIPPERGYPFQLVAQSKWGYKWIKWVTEIELSNDTEYQGYWESRGYSDSGDLDEFFLD